MSRIRVLVVDDSVVVRRLVSDVLARDPRIEVVGSAPNGRVALAKVEQAAPDIVTLDVEMPVMDGLETLAQLRRDHPRITVIMFSTLTERGATVTLDALEAGAHDYVTKPANVAGISESMEAVRAQLVPRIIALSSREVPAVHPVPTVGHRLTAVAGTATAPPRRPDPRNQRVDLVVIGASTGGPEALTTVLTALPGDLPVPVAVVQHMPPIFTRQFAGRLDTKCSLRVSEAATGDRAMPGSVLIAPGDFHLRLRRGPGPGVVSLDQGPPENYCRPALDVLFRSAVESYGRCVLAVVLTGMGSDGVRGCGEVVAAGGTVFAQDQATSVVWGMPGAVVAAGLAGRVLPLSEVAGAIVTRVTAERPGSPGRPLVGGSLA